MKMDRDKTKEQLLTELKELRLSRDTFDQILNGMFQSVVVIDPSYKIVDVNRCFLDHYSKSREKIIGQTCHEITHGVPQPCAEVECSCPLHEVIQTGLPVTLEHRHKDAQGNYLIVEISAFPLFDATGKVENIVEVLNDITERRQAEEALEYIFNLSPDMVGVFTTEGELVKINPAWATILGYKTEDLLEMGWATLVHPEDVERTMAEVEKQLIGNPVVDFTNRYKCKDGSYKTLEWRATFAKEGFIHAYARDITERKQAEEAVRESEEKYRTLFESSADGILIADSETRCFLYANSTICNMLGYSAEELTGMGVNGIHPEDELERVVAEFEAQARGEKTLVLDIPCLKRDGTIVYADINTANTVIAGNKCNIGFFRDTTERKQIEEKRQQMTRLESIGTLAGGIAHDFNNILTGIMGNISLAKMETRPGSNLQQTLEAAEKASLRAKELTQQLLTFSRGGAPVKQLASLAELLRDIASFALRGSNVKCQFSIADDLWHAEIDPGQISQVVNNLVMNAREAMPEGGTINLNASNTTVQGTYIKISIEDHGVGIKEEHLGRIFDPYFSSKQKGSGLGLATSYSIIKNHGGHIAVESTVGTGTTFHIYIPASRKTRAAEKETKAEVITTGGGRILVMDDEEIIRLLLSKILTGAGYEVELTKDGAEAVDLYRKTRESGQPFDAVIMDLTIPGGMGGKEAIKKLLEIDPNAKVIVSSGYASDPIMADFKKYGFSAAVAKPYNVAQIEKAVQSLLAKKK